MWGTSFGGATVGISLGDKKFNEIVDFAILDCPVSDMSYMIRYELESMKIGLPIAYMLFCGNIINKTKLGFTYSDANVCKAIANSTVLVLIFNSKLNTVTPEFMGKDIYNSISHDNKKLVTVDDSKHADIWLDYNKMYKGTVLQFINN